MALSLQDQLLKAGLASEKQAKKAQQEKRKQKKQQPKKKKGGVDEAALKARQAQLEKAERDRELERQRQVEAEQKAVQAQIRQMIEANRISCDNGDQPYQFADGSAVKRIMVTAAMRQQLASGRLGIVRHGKGYELVPAATLEKIRDRDAAHVVLYNEPQKEAEQRGDDPYAGYEVPDDLMW